MAEKQNSKKREFGSAQHGFYEIGVFGLNFKNCFVLLRSVINRKFGNIKPQLHKALGVSGNAPKLNNEIHQK